MRVNDAVLGVFLVIFATVLSAAALALPTIPGEVGPGVFPLLLGVGLGICGVLLFASGRKAGEPLVVIDGPRMQQEIVNVFALVAAVSFYLLFSDLFGFIATMSLMLFGLFRLLGARWLMSAVTALAVAVVISQSFDRFLRVPLPRGTLMSWFV